MSDCSTTYRAPGPLAAPYLGSGPQGTGLPASVLPDSLDSVGRRPTLKLTARQSNPHPPVSGVDQAHLGAAVQRELLRVLRPRPDQDLNSPDR